jgi:hypothetical protein
MSADEDTERGDAITDAVIAAASRGYEDDGVVKAARGDNGDPLAVLIVGEVESVAPWSESEEEARLAVWNALDDVIGRLRRVQDALTGDDGGAVDGE